jgi:hypothetical protein
MDEKNRRLGKRTDKYIQALFTRPIYSPIMPSVWEIGEEVGASDDELTDRIVERLESEHRGTDYVVLRNVRLEPLEDEFMLKTGKDYRGVFGDGFRRSTNVIWLKSDRMQQVRERTFKDFMDMYDEGRDPNIVHFDLSARARGYSTRQADDYIQKFFDLEPGESIEIKDHYNGGSDGRANACLAKRICGRLANEYKVRFYVHMGAVPKLVKVES